MTWAQNGKFETQFEFIDANMKGVRWLFEVL